MLCKHTIWKNACTRNWTKKRKPLFVLHGGNSVNAETLSFYLPLCNKYRIYAPDLIGHPGKSAQKQLSTKDLSYGQWATDVVNALNIAPVPFLGTSYGGSITLYTASFNPDIIEKAALVVPGSIAMANSISMGMKVMWPLISYRLFGGQKRLLRFTKQIVDDPTELTCQGIKLSFEHLKMNNLLPVISKKHLKKFNAKSFAEHFLSMFIQSIFSKENRKNWRKSKTGKRFKLPLEPQKVIIEILVYDDSRNDYFCNDVKPIFGT